jgi:hypothetical protein
VANANQTAPDRGPEQAGEIVGLIEAAMEIPPRMERDRNDDVDVRQEVGGGAPEEAGERRRERPPPVVFERVHDVPQRAVVDARAARKTEFRRTRQTSEAERRASGWCQRIAAACAARRRQRPHSAPALGTHDPRERVAQDEVAAGA